MMKRIVLIIVLAGLWVLHSANNTGVATNQAKDRTGSPVSQPQQCGQCHSGGAFSVNMNYRLIHSSGDTVTSYDPGETYTYQVEMNSSGASSFGFQTVGLLANNVQAGNLVALSSNTKIVTLSGRKYGEQTQRSSNGIFQMTWTAPAAGSGNVTFYAAGIGCNNSGNTSGDKAVTTSPFVVTENIIQSVEDHNTDIHIYPVPANDRITINSSFSNGNIEIYSMRGEKVMSFSFTGSSTDIDISLLPVGNYVLIVHDSSRFLSRQIQVVR